MTTRRNFIGGMSLLAAGTSAGLGFQSAKAATPDKAQKAIVLTGFGLLPNFIEIMNAYSGGHFARQGMDVQVVGSTGTAREMQQLVANQAQFGRVAALDQMIATSRQNVPLLAIATICQGSSFQLVSAKDKPIRKAEELKGKTVGIVSTGGSTDVFLDLILAKVGVAKDAVQRQPTGDNPGALEFLRRGRVDCFFCSLNTVVALQRSGAQIEYWSTDRYSPMPGQVYITTQTIAREMPDLVLHFLRAIKASVDELLTQPIAPIFHRAAADFEIPGLADMDTAVAVQQTTMKQLWLSEGRPNLLRNVDHLWADGATALRQASLASVDPTTLYTNRFIDQALKR
jgi:ABC-type nitrate/sulfonate/bicarbonate transport system substrate-binding protein